MQHKTAQRLIRATRALVIEARKVRDPYSADDKDWGGYVEEAHAAVEAVAIEAGTPTTDNVLRDLAENTPRNDWREKTDKLTGGALSDLARKADAAAQLYAELAAYFEARGGAGCGDRDEEDCRRWADKAVKRVRKALGYSNP